MPHLRASLGPMASRVRVTPTPCPECGTNLHVVESGILAAEVRRYCPRGCLLTVPGLTLTGLKVSG